MSLVEEFPCTQPLGLTPHQLLEPMRHAQPDALLMVKEVGAVGDARCDALAGGSLRAQRQQQRRSPPVRVALSLARRLAQSLLGGQRDGDATAGGSARASRRRRIGGRAGAMTCQRKQVLRSSVPEAVRCRMRAHPVSGRRAGTERGLPKRRRAVQRHLVERAPWRWHRSQVGRGAQR